GVRTRGGRPYTTETAAEIPQRPAHALVKPPESQGEQQMDLYVIRRPSAWANLKELEAAGAKSARIGNDEMSDRVRWIRSYVVHEPDGRIGTFCIYQARDGESIREHARRVGMPG